MPSILLHITRYGHVMQALLASTGRKQLFFRLLRRCNVFCSGTLPEAFCAFTLHSACTFTAEIPSAELFLSPLPICAHSTYSDLLIDVSLAPPFLLFKAR